MKGNLYLFGSALVCHLALLAAAGQKLQHIFQEKAKKDPSFISFSRADKVAVHEVIFAISQSNMEQLVQVLEDVSDPSSSNYGKHWSKSQVAEFTANKKSYNAVMEYLHSKDDVLIDRQSLYGEYIFAKAPVHVWEDVFATTFHTYQIPIDEENNAGEKPKQIIRAEEYSLPVELDGHVSTVLNTVQFHYDNAVKKRYKSDSNVPISVAQQQQQQQQQQHKDSPDQSRIRQQQEETPPMKSAAASNIEARPSAGTINHDSTLASTLQLNAPLYVPYYSASSTASATVNTVPYTFTSCSAGTIHIADCDPTRCSGSTANDQYIRLYSNSNGFQVAYNDDSCSSCSVIDYYTYSSTCQIYTLQQGCYSSKQCSGSFTITLLRLYTDTPTAQPTSVYSFGSVTPRFINQYYNVPSNTGNLLVSQALYETQKEGYSPSDLKMFQQIFGLPQQAAKTNQYGNFSSSCSSGGCYEGNLDVQYIMGIAQNVNTIYDYSPTDQYDFLSNWITSVSNTATPANVYSISWAQIELYTSPAFADVFNTEAIKLGVMGTTILAASGDDGATSWSTRRDASYCGYTPFFPASSPYVVAVGGTNGPPSNQPEVACQSGVWSNSSSITSGGGFSNVFSQPSWQAQAVSGYLALVKGTSKQPSSSNKISRGVNIGSYNTNGRAYPDVALLGHNYKVVVNCRLTFVDGTSASAPVMAAFVSLVNAQRKSKGMSAMGYINPFLYKYYASFTNDITSGDNKCAALSYIFTSYYPYIQYVHTCCEEGFYATRGWDPVTGLGSIQFDRFLATAMSVPVIFETSAPSPSPVGSSSSSSATTLIIIIVVVVVGAMILLAAVVGIRYCSIRNSSGSSVINRSVVDGPSSPVQYSSVIVEDGPAGSDAPVMVQARPVIIDAAPSTPSQEAEYDDRIEGGQQQVNAEGVSADGGHQHYAPTAIVTWKEDGDGVMV